MKQLSDLIFAPYHLTVSHTSPEVIEKFPFYYNFEDFLPYCKIEGQNFQSYSYYHILFSAFKCSPFILINNPGQLGISHFLKSYALYTITVKPNDSVMLMDDTFNHVKAAFKDIRYMIDNMEIIPDLNIKITPALTIANLSYMYFTNGSRLDCASNRRNTALRGRSINKLIIDNAETMADDLIQSVFPCIITGGQAIISGVLNDKDTAFQKLWESSEYMKIDLTGLTRI
jgi:hypothetical protein